MIASRRLLDKLGLIRPQILRAPCSDFFNRIRRTHSNQRVVRKQSGKDDIKQPRISQNIRNHFVRSPNGPPVAATRPLRLIVIAGAPYKLTLHGRTYYGEPAALLTTDLASAAGELIQAYCDRWQIEVNHRDEKDILGVGDAQVRSPLSVARQLSLQVAAYSLLLLAALQTHGPERTAAYLPLPKWRKHARRPSILDIVSLIRWELETLPANETRDCDSLRANLRENLVKYADT